jgi:hypothetical protein
MLMGVSSAAQTMGPFSGMAPIERLVTHAARQVQLLSALTPVEAQVERARLVGELRAGRWPRPRWRYAPQNHDRLRRTLEAAETALARGRPTPLEAVYLARVRELSLEAALCTAAGTVAVARLARARFGAQARPIARAASEMCAAWLGEPAPPAAGTCMRSDDPDTRSLLSRMRAAVGDLRLPFTVVPTPTLASLAATGERVILVATGRTATEEDTRRTVLHEIEGHARPRARSLRASSALFSAGTARGVDDQEGRALLLEERAGLLGSRRRRQLAARHCAVEAMLDGAPFAEVARSLVDSHGLDAGEAVVVAERAFRGSDGEHPGLGRERVYLECFVHVRAHLASRPEDERILESGQVAVDAVEALRPFAPR